MQLPDQPPHGQRKILDHAGGLGEPDNDLVEIRARELAEIAGLSPGDPADAYKHQAYLELYGSVDPNVPNDASGPAGDLTAEDDVIGESGGEIITAENASVDGDDETIGEALYSEGVSEATHDQMVESRRQERREDS